MDELGDELNDLRLELIVDLGLADGHVLSR
jgi:hypothetical protein